MRKNLEFYMGSNNEHIRQEYDLLRLQLGNILRELGGLRAESDDPENITLLDLDGLTAEVEGNDVVANGTLNRLIRDRLITETMATSLMNDNTYTYDVSIKLIEMAGILFAARAMELRETENILKLDDDELDGIVEQIEAEETREKGSVVQLQTVKSGRA